MTQDEKELLKMYFVNQGLRLDSEVLSARTLSNTRRDKRGCMALLYSLERKEAFNKFMHDVCALLDI